MEVILEEYLLTSQKMFYGLTTKKCRELAYQYAEKNNLKFPKSWKEKKLAGEDWFQGYMKRHPNLSIRKPEATSLARMTAFNRAKVRTFFDNLEGLKRQYNFQPNAIYNLDEIGNPMVPPVVKVIEKIGENQGGKMILKSTARTYFNSKLLTHFEFFLQVGQVTLSERGELVTQVGIICANGNALPPVFVFPRVRHNEPMMAKADPSALGLVNKSGWMTSESFLLILNFFKDNVRCDKEHPVLLIMDNHESHLSIAGIHFCRENGIHILTLPPHISNRLQPLDLCVFGPFKKYYSQAAQNWLLNHPNEMLSIFEVSELSCKAWDRAATPENIKSCFLKCGIEPFDRSIFKDHDFMSSSVSDRQDPSIIPESSNCSLAPPLGLFNQPDEVTLNLPLVPPLLPPLLQPNMIISPQQPMSSLSVDISPVPSKSTSNPTTPMVSPQDIFPYLI